MCLALRLSNTRLQVAKRKTHSHVVKSSDQPVTFADVQQAAKRNGVEIGCKILGPFYNITCRSSESGDDGLLGYSNGFIVPFISYMHCDVMVIFKERVQRIPKLRMHLLRLGLLLGVATFCHGFENGCRRAEALAINDNEETARRLIKYYQYFGFKTIREISGGLEDVLDMMIWGGVGTKMEASIEDTVHKWKGAIISID